jgi:hypothetical protein
MMSDDMVVFIDVIAKIFSLKLPIRVSGNITLKKREATTVHRFVLKTSFLARDSLIPEFERTVEA